MGEAGILDEGDHLTLLQVSSGYLGCGVVSWVVAQRIMHDLRWLPRPKWAWLEWESCRCTLSSGTRPLGIRHSFLSCVFLSSRYISGMWHIWENQHYVLVMFGRRAIFFRLCLCFCREIRYSLLKKWFVASGLFCFTYRSRRDVHMGFISLRIKLSTSSGPVAKNESEQFNQYMKNESEKKVAIREQEHAEPRHPLYLFFLFVLL